MRAGAVGFAVLLAATASGGIEHTILHGVSVGRVKAWVSPDQAPGLTASKLQAVAEASLSQGGVRVTPGTGSELFVGASATVFPSGDCVVYVDARLVEDATLERNGFHVQASSWSRSAVVADVREGCADSTATATRKVIDDFVEQFRAMNPEAAGK
jgi:hypothetical protein